MATHRIFFCVALAIAVAVLVSCSNKNSNGRARGGSSCTAASQALRSLSFRGTSLEPKQIALTFDDGPGPRTKQLSAYLEREGIQAAFFVNGKNMGPGSEDILQALVADGHLVANHTETHRSLTGASTATDRLPESEVLKELDDTDSKIDPFVPSKRFLFRPPFGDYDEVTFAALTNTPMNKYIGPILWDVGDKLDEAAGRAADWDCWQDGSDGKRTSMKTCGDLYLKEIRRADKGIVLMHDPSYNELDPEQLGTVDMVMYMVPILKQEGFTFTRVDKVPDIAAVLPPLPPEEAALGTPTNADAGPAPGGTSDSMASPGASEDADPCR